ncbi:MAG TPA: RidA family protein [Planctomycetota bacterium]|nr:RidA family protein [Planctomycetota bacterium]
MSHEVVNPPSLGEAKGYANGIVAQGRILFIAGQVGWDEKHIFAKGFAAQFERALANVVAVLTAAGGKPEALARMTIYVTDKQQYRAATRDIGRVWREKLGRWYPAMTLVEVKALLEDEALLELEATAVL